MRILAALVLLALGGLVALALFLRAPDVEVVAPSAGLPHAGRLDAPTREPIEAEPTESARVDALVADAERVELATPSSSKPATRVLRGIVTDGRDGPPLADVALELVTNAPPRATLARVVTDAAGRFATPPLPCTELFLRHLPDLEVPERAVALWVQPTTFTLPASANGAPHERAFWVQRPDAVVAVDVVHADNRPAARAFVQLPFTALDLATGGRRTTSGAAETNSQGRAQVALYDSAGFERGTLFARGADGSVSEVLALDTSNYTGPHRLRLGAGCTLVVHARWSEGTPAAGRAVRLDGPRDFPRHGEPERFRGVTDAAGTCTFTGLYPAAYTAAVENPRTQGTSNGSATLRADRATELEVVLRAGEHELAANGSVVDENGAALAGVELVFRADARWAERCVSDERGRFECWAKPCDALWIALDASPHADQFEPAERTVPFGAHGLVFQRVARAVSTRFVVRATDRASGVTLDELYLTFDRGPERAEWSNTFAPRESYVVDATPATRCRIAARGYVAQEFALLAALEAAPGDPPRLEVALDRGLAHGVRVLDLDTRAPIAGASFSAHGLPTVRTDSDGRARLEGDRWAVHAVTCDGYEPASWDPEEAILFDHGPVFLSARE